MNSLLIYSSWPLSIAFQSMRSSFHHMQQVSVSELVNGAQFSLLKMADVIIIELASSEAYSQLYTYLKKNKISISKKKIVYFPVKSDGIFIMDESLSSWQMVVPYVSSESLETLFVHFIKSAEKEIIKKPSGELMQLSYLEYLVVESFSQGLSVNDIIKKHALSARGVSYYKRKVMRKLGINNHLYFHSFASQLHDYLVHRDDRVFSGCQQIYLRVINPHASKIWHTVLWDKLLPDWLATGELTLS